MKKIAILSITALAAFFIPPSSFGQGALTPPGPPAPTMLSLSQIEPRAPVDATHTPTSQYGEFSIQRPGSYYLTTNLLGVSGKYGIEIMTNHVSLDLNGFALLGGGAGGGGVVIDAGAGDVTIRNGMISGWGDGVDTSASDTVVENVKIIGCFGSGILKIGSPASMVVRNCLCESNGSASSDNGIAIGGGVISGCVVVNNNVGEAIAISGPGRVSDCVVAGNTGYGLYVNGGGDQIVDNTCVSNQSVNLLIVSGNNRIEDNHVVTTPGVVGIEVAGNEDANNIVIRNSVIGDGAANYSNPGNNDFGPIGTAASSTSPWANFSH